MSTIGGILIGFLMLGLMMTIHELGHYLTGRKLGFAIKRFQIFMGPKLVTWYRQGIEYNICLIPIGAAVHFVGEYDAAEVDDKALNMPVETGDQDDIDRSGWFTNKTKRERAAVIFAGPLVNILSGILAFILLFIITGMPVPKVQFVESDTRLASAGVLPGDTLLRVNHQPIRNDIDLATVQMLSNPEEPLLLDIERNGEEKSLVSEPEKVTRFRLGIQLKPNQDQLIVQSVAPGNNNGRPGLQAGDIILKIDNEPVRFADLQYVLQTKKADAYLMTIERNGQQKVIEMRSQKQTGYLPYGFSMSLDRHALRAVPYAFSYSWSFVRSTFKGLGALITGRLKPDQSLSGPVGIVNMITGVVKAEAASLGEKCLMLLRLFALLSLSLGIMNLLPIPMLDGNQLLLLGVEGIRGRPLKPKTQTIVSIIGIVILLLLMVFSLYYDLVRLFR